MVQNKSTSGKKAEKEETSLKGTFVSVMLLGAFIIISWAGVYMLFVSR